MKPMVAHPSGNPGDAFLVDLHATAFTPRIQGSEIKPGKVAQVALVAVAIKHLRAGQLHVIDGRQYPRPCQVVATDEWTTNAPMARGIYPDAARALLSIDHGFKTSVAPGAEFKAGTPAAGFNQWDFLTAWGWSRWQASHLAGDKWTLERRWEALRAIGFPGTAGAFRQICSRLGLSVTRSRPIL